MIVRKSQCQELEAAGHTTLTFRKPRPMDICSQPALSFLFRPGSEPSDWCYPPPVLIFPPQPNLGNCSVHACPEMR